LVRDLVVMWTRDNAGKVAIGELTWETHEGVPASALRATERLEQRAMRRLGFVFGTYHVGAPFFELFEMLRKLLLTSVLQFVDPGSTTQITVATLVNFAALCISFRYSPFPDDNVDAFNQVALTQLFLTTFCALLLFVESDDEDDQVYFRFLVCACQLGLPAFPILVKLYTGVNAGVRRFVLRETTRFLKRVLKPPLAELNDAILGSLRDACESSGAEGLVAEGAGVVADGAGAAAAAKAKVDAAKSELDGLLIKAENMRAEVAKRVADTEAALTLTGAPEQADSAVAQLAQELAVVEKNIERLQALVNKVAGAPEAAVKKAEERLVRWFQGSRVGKLVRKGWAVLHLLEQEDLLDTFGLHPDSRAIIKRVLTSPTEIAADGAEKVVRSHLGVAKTIRPDRVSKAWA